MQLIYVFDCSMNGFLQILGGYVFDAFLTPWTLLIKALGLALAVASGLSLGKEVNDFSRSRVISVFNIYIRVPLSMWHVACHTCCPKFSRNSEPMKVLTLLFVTTQSPDIPSIAQKRKLMAAAAAAGVSVAFGSPLGGVLFGLEGICNNPRVG
jgi:chloride channel 3/4/5